MEWIMKVKESTCVETVNHSGNGHGIGFLATSEQFSTRSCARCAGLLVEDWCYDLINSGEHTAEVFRCVQCGYRVDPVILRNQARPQTETAAKDIPSKVTPRAGRWRMWLRKSKREEQIRANRGLVPEYKGKGRRYGLQRQTREPVVDRVSRWRRGANQTVHPTLAQA
jgi:hypothetical protein